VQEILQPGTTLEGRYRLVSEAAPQDLGSLYRGYDTVDDQLVMILVLPFQVAAGSEVLGQLSRVQRAVAALGEPALVGYEYGGVAEGRLYLVRRQVEGRPLADLLAGGPLDPSTAATITIALSGLVAILHRAGMVHGSLCPHCVYVDSSGAGPLVFVTDCGLLPALREVQAPPGRPWGRAPYLSPEQAAGEEIHPASDVYVIGSLLYAMLAGRPPFRASDETVLVVQHLRQEPPALDALRPDLSPALVQIVHKALAKEPAARYRNAGQLAEILTSQVAAQADVGAPPRAPHPHMRVPAPQAGPGLFGAREPQVSRYGDGIDWVMIALVIAALLAMLGLVRLWRAVYERYTPPAVMGQWLSGRLEDWKVGQPSSLPTFQPSNLPLPHKVRSWFIAPLSGIIAMPRDMEAGNAARDCWPGYGVKITGFAGGLC
jgi:serine/threonine protein kinase